MFNDSGKKIKAIALVSFVFSAVISIVAGIIISVCFKSFAWAGFVIALLGFAASWLSTIFIYAFGEMVDKICEININLEMIKNVQALQNISNNQNSNSESGEKQQPLD